MSTLATMNIKDFAAYINIGERKMREIVKIDGFPRLQIGKKSLILADEAEKWIVENYQRIKV